MNDKVANRPDGEANAAHPSTNDLASVASNGLGVLRAIMAVSDDCIKVLDLSGRVLFLNDGGVRALELERSDDLVGKVWSEFWSGEGRRLAENGVSAALGGTSSTFHGDAATAKGTSKSWDVRIAPVLNADGKPTSILVHSRDISQSRLDARQIAALLKQARATETELRASEAKLRTMTDAMPQMVWSTLPDGFHDYYNARWYEFTGVPAGSTDGDGWNNMFHPEDQERALERWNSSLNSGEPYEIEYRLRHHSGEYRWTLGRAMPLRNADGEIIRWFGTCTDIDTAKKNAELLAILSQELSHRIKNIFAIVLALVGMSARKDPRHAPFADSLRDRIAALGRAHDFARPHSEESRPTIETGTLHGLIREILRPYPALEEGRIEIAGPDVAADDKAATPFALLIHELATNAVKYGALSTASGQVHISTADLDRTVALTWVETGGPGGSNWSEKKGFGTQLLDTTARGHLGGSITREWTPDGLRARIEFPKTALTRD